MSKWTIQTDGGSPKNPGPAAFAFIVECGLMCPEGRVKRSGYLPEATNNEAEYKAIIAALYWLCTGTTREWPNEVEFFSDSEVVVRQINGVYQVKQEHLKPLHAEVMKLKDVLRMNDVKLTFKWFRREDNTEADELCNEVLRKRGYEFASKKVKKEKVTI